jgi:hypothetical protein
MSSHPAEHPSEPNSRSTVVEYAMQLARAPSGRLLCQVIRRTSSSATVIYSVTTDRGAWSTSELADHFARFEALVNSELILTGGVQLTLPISD